MSNLCFLFGKSLQVRSIKLGNGNSRWGLACAVLDDEVTARTAYRVWSIENEYMSIQHMNEEAGYDRTG